MNYLATEMGWEEQNKRPRLLIQRFADFLGPLFYKLNPWIELFNPETDYNAHPGLVFPSPMEWDYGRSYLESFNYKNWFRSTLETPQGLLATPGDLNRALNARFRDNLRYMLFSLAGELPLILNPANCVVGPEYKAYGKRMKINGLCESTVTGLYGAGDGEIETHGINPSEVSGFTAAVGVLNREGIVVRIGVETGSYPGEHVITPEFYGPRVLERV
ncbi:hypothetical protein COY95_01320 [Candidatus Woesearchaeota archaeon CG_4_10_14_0_8_um_filter_47_5]|nr:MAG: hypothetical protein COY95_01320 [Candidatus Woesearchaeota archaeon CG_4_10_14_0_8_um_filter_47_5]